MLGNILITGANRGIGLELVKQLTSKSLAKCLVACCRDTSAATDLTAIQNANKNVHVLQLDVTNDAHIEAGRQKCVELFGSDGLDLLLNNAGVMKRCSLDDCSRDVLQDSFNVNCVSQCMMIKAFQPLLVIAGKRHKAAGDGQKPMIMNFSTKMGSIADASSGNYAYRLSKTSLNMLSKIVANELKNSNVNCVAIHPGWVLTDMGGPNALISTETCVSSIIEKVLVNFDETRNGGFIDYKGDVIPY